ncbi:MAG: DUF58 domain-containing protein [Lachnospiraceae bacterium]|nr:DUF58 domain-containing protein [Lachnospiraceae bacterium]
MVIFLIALFAGALFLLQRFLYRRFWNSGITVKLSFSDEAVNAGERTSLLEIVENRKWLPLATLKVKFQCSKALKFSDTDNSAVTDKYYRNDLFSVMPYQRITRTHKIECPQRGYYGIYGIDLVGADLFFSVEMHGHLDSDSRLYVLPKMYQSLFLDSAIKKINGEVAVRRHEAEDPFTYRGIREYEPYDEMKAINWKATAGTGELKVNVREHTAVKAVRIFLNLQDNNILRREELLEASVSICARMVWELLNQGVQTAVYANARDCMTGQIMNLQGTAAAGGTEAIFKSLARLDFHKETEDFSVCFGEKLFREEGLYTVFISPNRHEDFQGLLSAYKEREDFCWLCPVKEIDDGNIRPELAGSIKMILEERD